MLVFRTFDWQKLTKISIIGGGVTPPTPSPRSRHPWKRVKNALARSKEKRYIYVYPTCHLRPLAEQKKQREKGKYHLYKSHTIIILRIVFCSWKLLQTLIF